jgi:hypothetical protein
MPKPLLVLLLLIAFFTLFILLPRAEEAPGGFDRLGGSTFVELQLGAWGGPRATEFAVDTLENQGNWRALRIPLSTGQTYAEIPAFFTWGLGLHYDTAFEIRTRWPLRRDMEAWFQDGLRLTQTLSPSELDLNVPTEAWAIWRNPIGFVRFGRFRPEISPSENGLVLSGTPWHDALHWKAAVGLARYDFVLSSLNPWLSQAEEVLQSERTHPNQWGRIYNEPVKTLLLHRVGIEMDWGWAALIEQSLVGGKEVEFRDMSPFTAWHNNFSEGFTKASTTFELGLTPNKKGAFANAFYWQFVIEDVQSPVGETEGYTNPATFGFLAGYRQKISLNQYGNLTNKLDVVWTDPNFNNHFIPYLKMQSRRVYRSNFREQGAPNYADRYIVDYPLGYRRGPDALDLWWNLDYLAPGKKWGLAGEFAWLRQGECRLWSDYEACGSQETPSGVVERIFQYELSGWWNPLPAVRFYLGAGILDYANRENVPGKNETRLYSQGGAVLHLGLGE